MSPGEESARQIKMRAKRLGVGDSGMYVLSETNMDEIEAQRSVLTPDYMIVDSIQTVYVPGKNAAPGSVSQVREATSILMRAAKQAGHHHFPRWARHQGGRAGRPSRAGAYGGRGALF